MTHEEIRERALELCRSQKHNVQGVCALVCMAQPGDPRKRGCDYAEQVFSRMVQAQSGK